MATNKVAAPFFAATAALRTVEEVIQNQVLVNVRAEKTGDDGQYEVEVEALLDEIKDLRKRLSGELATIRAEVMVSRPYFS